jgi:hypothetical protein
MSGRLCCNFAGAMTVFSLLITGFCLADEPPFKPMPAQKAKRPFQPKITISKETTWATEPVGPDGFIDYMAVMNRHYSRGVTPENNAVVLLYQATGPAPDHRRQPVEFFRLLGVDPPPIEGDYFELVEDWALRTELVDREVGRQGIRNLADQTALRPWTVAEFPQIAQWLDSIAAPLRRVTDATERSAYYSPFVTSPGPEVGMLISVNLPGVQMGRAIARALNSRAMLSLGEQNWFQAWSDLLTVHRLGRLVGSGPSVTEGFVGIAIETMAMEGELRFISESRPTAKFISRYLKQLKSLPPRASMADKIDLDGRATFLDCCQQIARDRATLAQFAVMPDFWQANPDQTWVDKMIDRLLLQAVDWDKILKSGNRLYDRILVAARLSDHQKRIAALKELDEEIKRIKVRVRGVSRLSLLINRVVATQYLADLLPSLLLPSVNQILGADNLVRQRYQNLEIAFALAAWRSEHTTNPENLVELVPMYLATVPTDLFNDQPLRYERIADGYRFYSVGKNVKDDMGLTYGEGEGKDDLVVRMPVPKPAR